MTRLLIVLNIPLYTNIRFVSAPANSTLSMLVDFILRPLWVLRYYLHTAILFTWTDYKTIFFPIVSPWFSPAYIRLNTTQVVFACATTPIQSFSSLLHCCIWVWFHQLLCNVSNQARSCEEDKLNHPWRPLPSRRISEPKAVALRWTMVAFCIYLSSIYDQDLVMTTLSLVATTLMYDELGAARNVVGKALCATAGYTSFEVGATIIIGM
jgi:hypothetical protein